MSDEICQCGFGEEYFTIEEGESICTVCGGRVAVAEDPPADQGSRQPAMRVLIVDDQPFFRRRIMEALSGRGSDVLEAGEGLEAVRLLGESIRGSAADPSQRISLVVLDLTMPGLIDGFQTLGVIKAMDEALPVIILTSSPPTPDLLKKLGQLKAKKYLNKASKDLEGLLLRNLETL